MDQLYFVENVGCDDTTCGLVRISDEDFPKFKSFIENLNRNSYYQCMPTISVRKIDESQIRESTEKDERWSLVYLEDKTYVLKDSCDRWNLEVVIE